MQSYLQCCPDGFEFGFDTREYFVGVLALVGSAAWCTQFVAYGFDAGDVHFIAQVLDLLDKVNVGLPIVAIVVTIRSGSYAAELFFPKAQGGSGYAHKFGYFGNGIKYFMFVLFCH